MEQRAGSSRGAMMPHPSDACRSPRIVCALPVRNGARDLPGWLESVERFADAVVALDDGSTDDTAALLQAHPLVEVLIRNPRRSSYRGWNDASNRNRLLAASASARPDWIVMLDADERIDAADALALRDFVAREAVPGCAYGMRVYRMLDERGGYDDCALWVYRLFAYVPGQRVRARELHDLPIPEDIPNTRWIRTTLRIQHFGAMTAERRRARFSKYGEADPDHRWQSTYDHLLNPPGPRLQWSPRAHGVPVLAQVSSATRPLHNREGPAPTISVIIIAEDGEDGIQRVVRSAVEQVCPEPFEVIVVAGATDRASEIVRLGFPGVTVVQLESVTPPGAARNAGLLRARGEFVTFLGSNVAIQPGSLAARLRAHRAGYPVVAQATINATESSAGWASYFLSHCSLLPGGPSGVVGGPAHACSYVTADLFDVNGFDEDVGAHADALVKRELSRRGQRVYRDQKFRIVSHAPCRTVGDLAAEEFERGRGLGRVLLRDLRDRPLPWRAYLVVRFVLLYAPNRLLKVSRDVRRWRGRLRRAYRRVFPLVVIGTLSALAGLALEVVLGVCRTLHDLVVATLLRFHQGHHEQELV